MMIESLSDDGGRMKQAVDKNRFRDPKNKENEGGSGSDNKASVMPTLTLKHQSPMDTSSTSNNNPHRTLRMKGVSTGSRPRRNGEGLPNRQHGTTRGSNKAHHGGSKAAQSAATSQKSPSSPTRWGSISAADHPETGAAGSVHEISSSRSIAEAAARASVMLKLEPMLGRGRKPGQHLKSVTAAARVAELSTIVEVNSDIFSDSDASSTVMMTPSAESGGNLNSLTYSPSGDHSSDEASGYLPSTLTIRGSGGDNGGLAGSALRSWWHVIGSSNSQNEGHGDSFSNDEGGNVIGGWGQRSTSSGSSTKGVKGGMENSIKGQDSFGSDGGNSTDASAVLGGMATRSHPYPEGEGLEEYDLATAESGRSRRNRRRVRANDVDKSDLLEGRGKLGGLVGIAVLFVFISIVVGVAVYLLVLDYQGGGWRRRSSDSSNADTVGVDGSRVSQPTSPPTKNVVRDETLLLSTDITDEDGGATLQLLVMLSGADRLTDTSTPQFRAAKWIIEDDPLDLRAAQIDGSAEFASWGSSVSPGEVVVPERILQRYTLALFYESLVRNANERRSSTRRLSESKMSARQKFFGQRNCVPTKGARRQRNEEHRRTEVEQRNEFLSGVDECRWPGISCTPMSYVSPTGVTTRKVVTAIDLPESGLTGRLPLELSALSHLEEISLFGNSIYGGVPPSIFRLQNLYWLDLSANFMSGVVPPIGPNMQYLYLSDNAFYGRLPLPEDSTVSTASSTTKTTTTTSSFTTGYQLIHLWMDFNDLHGPIPTSIGRMKNLQSMIVFKNNLTDAMPDDVAGLTNLTYLDLSFNSFSGSLPLSFYSLRALKNAYLNSNRFSGKIKIDIAHLDRLEDLWLHDNSFTGSVRGALRNLTSLSSLLLQNNGFSGSIPSTVCSLRHEGNLQVLVADCNSTNDEPGDAFVECNCCTTCL